MSEEDLDLTGDGEVDWTDAKLVYPEARKSVHLRVDPYVFDFFKAKGHGHISRMHAILKAYVYAHKRNFTSVRFTGY
jgi:uncharacterized protein (DUF4415 family)